MPHSDTTKNTQDINTITSTQKTVTVTESELNEPASAQSTPNEASSSDAALGPMDEADDYLSDANYKLAAEKYSEAIMEKKLPPNVPVEEAISRRSQCYQRLSLFEQAEADCRKIIETSDKPYFLSEAYRRIGDIIIDADQFSPHGNPASKVEAATRAVQYYHKSLEHDNNEEVFYAMGNALLVLKQWKLATRAFRDALRLEGDFAPAYQGRAEANIAQQLWPQAKDDYEKFLQLQEDYFASFTSGDEVDVNVKSAICQAHLKLALIGVEMMEVEDIKKHCDEIIQINHMYVPQAYGYQARALFLEGKFWECIESCNEALKRDASLFRIFKVRAAAYGQLGLTTEAKADEDTFQFLSSKRQTQSYKSSMELQLRLQKLVENPEKLS